MVSVVKMATVLEVYPTEEKRSVMLFLLPEGLNAKYMHKVMFPVYRGKCLSLKADHNWVEYISKGISKVADDARPGAEVFETTVKRLLYCGFRRTRKTMGQVYQCW
jgi:hypothetical protein